jgi:transcription elongation factor Elf1
MTDELAERTVVCPSCWEETTVVIDVSEGDQVLVEDCGVCCNPMQLTIAVVDGEIAGVDVEPAQ